MSGNKADESQQKVILAEDGEFLVLAPPGCGKTHVLAERVRHARTLGASYDDMLCLTFTNRAARGMRERIKESVHESGVERVYVGNIHRFCSRFLLDYALVPAETGIIDDDDAVSIMAQFLGEEENVFAGRRRRQCFDAVHLAAFMYQIEHRHPKELRIHPECLTRDDKLALRHLCDVRRVPFTPETMTEIYRGAGGWKNMIESGEYRAEWRPALVAMLKKMELALYYDRYKRDNRLIDFEDLLLFTYDALSHENELSGGDSHSCFRHYSWCQVDEVQDLNPLQMKIVDLLMAPHGTVPKRTMMFLGDGQQAIFSFMGAKTGMLDRLKERCEGRVFTLSTNHRSPKYLLDVFNTYAAEVLKIDPDFLPEARTDVPCTGNELSVVCSNTLEGEYSDVAQQAARLSGQYPGETTAVIVLTNNDAESISKRMDEMGVGHFKVSGTDLFSTPEVKLLIACLSVFVGDHNFLAWSRLLKGFRVFERNASARAFVRRLSDCALTPADLMLREGSSYVKEFVRAYEEEEMVVFDTETTGLNVCEDDIVQIAAVKMRNGNMVPGSEFSVFITTDREIPLMLGDIVNPVIEERKQHRLLPPDEALSLFASYAGSDILLGHNSGYDCSIHNWNMKRYLPTCSLLSRQPVCFDTL